MVQFTALFLFCLCALFASSPGAAQQPALPADLTPTGAVQPISAGRGLAGEVRTFRRGADKSVVKLVTVFAAPAAVRVSIVPVNQKGPADRLFGGIGCAGANVLINGSFYVQTLRGNRALGLVRIGGQTLSAPSARRSGGFLVIGEDGARVLPRVSKAAALAARDAIEATPVIELDARSGIRSDDRVRFDRVGIGSTVGGNMVIVGAFGNDQNSVSLFEFEKLAAWSVASHTEVLREMIGLDGGPSAHISIPRDGQFFGYRGVAYLPNAICVAGR